MNHSYKTQVASDIHRDGLGVELVTESGKVVAEIFRSDSEQTVVVNTFSYDIPLEALELLIVRAKERLAPFQSGQLLSQAVLIAPKLVTTKSPVSDGAQLFVQADR